MQIVYALHTAHTKAADGKRLNLADSPEEFEYYYTAFHNTVLYGEALEKTGVMKKLRIGPSFRSHISKQEWTSLNREYYFGLVSLLQRYGNSYWVGVLTEQFFIHHLFSITFPTRFRRSVQDWCRAVAEIRYGKDVLRESVRQDGDQVHFRLLAGDEPLINLQGTAIKTLRGKAYKALLIRLLDAPPELPDDGIEVIRLRRGEELPAGLLEGLDVRPWGDETDEEEDSEVVLHLSPRQEQLVSEEARPNLVMRRRKI